jgi:hypothetical protein
MIGRKLSMELTTMWNVDIAVWYRFTDVTELTTSTRRPESPVLKS